MAETSTKMLIPLTMTPYAAYACNFAHNSTVYIAILPKMITSKH